MVPIFHRYLSREIYTVGLSNWYNTAWRTLHENRLRCTPRTLCTEIASSLLWTIVLEEEFTDKNVRERHLHRLFFTFVGHVLEGTEAKQKWRINGLSYVQLNRDSGEVLVLLRAALGAALEICDRDSFLVTGDAPFRPATVRLLRAYFTSLQVFDRHIFHQMFAFAHGSFQHYDAAQHKTLSTAYEGYVTQMYYSVRTPPQTPSTPHGVPVEIQSLIIEFLCGEPLNVLKDKWRIVYDVVRRVRLCAWASQLRLRLRPGPKHDLPVM